MPLKGTPATAWTPRTTTGSPSSGRARQAKTPAGVPRNGGRMIMMIMITKTITNNDNDNDNDKVNDNTDNNNDNDNDT